MASRKSLMLFSFIMIHLFLQSNSCFYNYPEDGPDTIYVWTDFVKARNYTEAGNYDSAIFFFYKATNRYEELEMWDNYVNCLNQAGELSIYLGRLEEADEAVKKAFTIGVEHFGEIHPGIADSYDVMGFSKYTKGLLDEGLKYYQKALSIRLETLDANNGKIAESYTNIGIYYVDKGMYSKAIQYYQKGLRIQLATMDENDPYIASSYNNIGNIYNHIGKYDTAIFYYDKMYRIFKEILEEDHVYYSFYYSGASIAYEKLHDYKKALDFQHKALTIRINNYGEGSLLVTDSYKSLALQYISAGEFEKALQNVNTALNILTKTYGKKHIEVARCYNILGLNYKSMEKYARALEYYKKSVAINIEVFGEQNPRVATNYHNIASLYSVLKEFDSAYYYFNKTIYFQKNILNGQGPEIAGSYNELGNTYLDDKKYVKAIDSYQLAISANIEGFDSRDIFKNPNIYGALSKFELVRSLSGKADAFYQKYKNNPSVPDDLKMSFNTYDLVFKLIDLMQREYNSPESKLYLTESTGEIMEKMILAAFDYHKATNDYFVYTRMFEYAERSKASNLLVAIKSDEALSFGNIPEPLVQFEKELKHEMSAYNELIYDENAKEKKDSLKIALWGNHLFKLDRQSDSLIYSFESSYPQYYKLKYESGIANVEKVRQIIQKDEALIEYRICDKVLFTYVITADDYFVLSQNLEVNLEETTADYLNLLKDNNVEKTDNSQGFLSLSYTLYSILLKPIDSLINVKRLIIVPDGIIGYIPFETLLTEMVHADSGDYSDLPYLINNLSVHYAYSATLYSLSAEKNRSRINVDNDFMLLAMAPFSSDKGNVKPGNDILSALRERGIDQTSLPGTKTEVEKINELFPGTIYYDSTATEMAFWDNAGSYRILHIASHGIIDDVNPMYSKLLFYRDKQDSIYDGELNTYELFNMGLNADIAVLSACNTGSGKLQKGEGVMSLARGFLYAGVPSIVMTLWSVDDISSAELMDYFYAYLKKGKSKDEALRFAKLDYLAKTNNPEKLHPKYWAGYVLIGDNSSIAKGNPVWRFLIFSLIIVFLGLTWFIIKRKRRL